MGEAGPFFVILSRPEIPPIDTVSGVLSAAFGISRMDAVLLAKKSWGFLGERLSEGAARSLASAAERAGVAVRTLSESDLTSPSTIEPIHQAGCSAEGFRFLHRGAEHGLSWDRLRLIGAANLREEARVMKNVKQGPTGAQRVMGMGLTMMTGIPIRLGGKSKEVQKAVRQADYFYYMDLFFLTDEGLTQFHIPAQGFNFAYLGNRREPSVMNNFRLFLEDLAAAAPHAVKNKGAEIILAGRPQASMGYDSPEDYEKECRWLLNLIER
jgi:hypothetical protein